MTPNQETHLYGPAKSVRRYWLWRGGYNRKTTIKKTQIMASEYAPEETCPLAASSVTYEKTSSDPNNTHHSAKIRLRLRNSAWPADETANHIRTKKMTPSTMMEIDWSEESS